MFEAEHRHLRGHIVWLQVKLTKKILQIDIRHQGNIPNLFTNLENR